MSLFSVVAWIGTDTPQEHNQAALLSASLWLPLEMTAELGDLNPWGNKVPTWDTLEERKKQNKKNTCERGDNVVAVSFLRKLSLF